MGLRLCATQECSTGGHALLRDMRNKIFTSSTQTPYIWHFSGHSRTRVLLIRMGVNVSHNIRRCPCSHCSSYTMHPHGSNPHRHPCIVSHIPPRHPKGMHATKLAACPPAFKGNYIRARPVSTTSTSTSFLL